MFAKKHLTGLKLLIRDWRGGELGLLLASIILATATITCIQIFSDRLTQSLTNEASEFLAGDVQVKSSKPIPASIVNEAHRLDVATANSISFRAMVFSEDNAMQISAVKGVSSSYPLKGSLDITTALRLKSSLDKKSQVNQGPKPGDVWLAPRLAKSLELELNDNVFIGEAEFTFSAVILREPDNAQSMFGIAPRAMIHEIDIEKTQAVQLGSRINYNWMLAAKPSTIAKLKAFFDENADYHYRWQDIKSANRTLSSALDRAEQFLLLTGSLGVVLCGLAIALAARRYATRQISHVAILKTLGLTPGHITQLYMINLFLVGLIALIPGVFLGWIAHFAIIYSLDALFTVQLVSPSAFPFVFGGLAGGIIFIGFSFPPIYRLKKISPASILRFDESNNIPFNASTWMPGFIITLLLIFAYSQSGTLSFILFAGLLVCSLGVLIASIVIHFGHRAFGRVQNGNLLANATGLRLGLTNIFRHRKMNSLQIFVFSTLLMLLFTLTLVRTQLISQWQNQAPEGTPNHFLFNIFSQDRENIDALFKDNGIENSPFYPMTRGRLASVNDIPVETLLENLKTDQNYERELNLTWSQTLGLDNTVIDGEWFSSTHKNTTNIHVSAERRYAEGLGMKVGDTLVFSVSGESVTATITSIREVEWDSMNPNFYMIFDQPLLGGTIANWLTSFYLPDNSQTFVTDLLKAYPTLSIIALDQILKQVQSIISQVTRAVEFLLILVLAAGILVLLSSVQASLDVRKQESAVIKTLGGDKSLIQHILLVEFTALGALAGLLASMGSTLALFFIQTRFMQMAYESNMALWVLGPIIGMLPIGAIGWLSTKHLTATPPMEVLRELA